MIVSSVLRRGALAFAALSVLSVGVVAIELTQAAPAQAACATPEVVGSWHNVNPATRGLTRLEVGIVCGGVVCSANGTCSSWPTYLTVRPYGKCSPTDCDWGQKPLVGYPGVAQTYYTDYVYSWATKRVAIRSYTVNGVKHLTIWVTTDFTAADGRTDYTSVEDMVH